MIRLSHQSKAAQQAQASASHTSRVAAPHTNFTRLLSSSASARMVPASSSSAASRDEQQQRYQQCESHLPGMIIGQARPDEADEEQQ
jgi:hypothetical protein